MEADAWRLLAYFTVGTVFVGWFVVRMRNAEPTRKRKRGKVRGIPRSLPTTPWSGHDYGGPVDGYDCGDGFDGGDCGD